MAKIPVEVHVSSEFAYNLPLMSKNRYLFLLRKVAKLPTVVNVLLK